MQIDFLSNIGQLTQWRRLFLRSNVRKQSFMTFVYLLFCLVERSASWPLHFCWPQLCGQLTAQWVCHCQRLCESKQGTAKILIDWESHRIPNQSLFLSFPGNTNTLSNSSWSLDHITYIFFSRRALSVVSMRRRSRAVNVVLSKNNRCNCSRAIFSLKQISMALSLRSCAILVPRSRTIPHWYRALSYRKTGCFSFTTPHCSLSLKIRQTADCTLHLCLMTSENSLFLLHLFLLFLKV